MVDWRIVSLAVAGFSVVVGLALGPIFTIVFFSTKGVEYRPRGPAEDRPTILALYVYSVYVMWLLFIAGIFLMVGLLLGKLRYVFAYVLLTGAQMGICLVVCVCCVIVQIVAFRPINPRMSREDESQILEAIIFLYGAFTYIALQIGAIFVILKYKESVED